MTTERRIIAGAALGLALLVAACGGSSTASTAPASGAAPASVAAPTDAPETQEAASEAASDDSGAAATDDSAGMPSLAAGAAADLEAMLPAEANGIKFTKSSFDGKSMGALAAGIDTGQLDPILKKYGKTLNDVSFALAAPADSSSGETATVLAIRLAGVPATDFLDVASGGAKSMKTTNIGGKDVYSAGAGGMNVIVYPKDDVLFEILLASDATSKAILAALP